MRHSTLTAAALMTFCAGSAAAQGIEDLVRHDAANSSATITETRSIAAYLADRNKSTLVQVLSRPQPSAGLAMTLGELLAVIGAEAADRAATAAPAPAVTPAAAPEPQPAIVPAAAPAVAPPPTQRPCETFKWNSCLTEIEREREGREGGRGRGGGGQRGGGEPDRGW